MIVDALTEQASQLIHTSNQFYTVPQLELADLLVDNSVFDRVFFSNSGVEANEGAVKLARKYGQHKRNGAYEVITTDHSFHGRSLAMLTATGKPAYKQDYGPLPAGFLAEPVPFNDLEAVKKATTDKTCAVMVEPVQGEGGVNPATKEYLQGLRDWCDENNLVLIFDEVQTGRRAARDALGLRAVRRRAGRDDAGEGSRRRRPDRAILCNEKVNIFTYGDHGSTFGGNPLATAVALAVVRETLKEDLPGHAKKVGDYLQQKLNELRADRPYITDVRGLRAAGRHRV